MTLDALAPGQQATVTGIRGTGPFRRRLLELGLVPGTVVIRTDQAPWGDPLTYRLRGSTLAIRTPDARLVDVEAR